MAMGLFYYGLRDTSATYSINFLNLIPIFTFLVSIICRIEKLGIETWAGKAKTLGTILCVGGALTTSLYTGKEFHIDHHTHHSHSHSPSGKPPETHMLRGTLFLVASCMSYTAWYIVQVKLLKVLPLKYWATMLSCMMASVQAAGALATAATFCLISWAISLKGPTYPPIFNPLALIFVAFSEAIFLGEPLRVGTLIGMVLIISGLYSFLWGKRKETQTGLPQPNVAAGDVSTGITIESTGTPHSAKAIVDRFEFVNLYEKRLGDAGYINFNLGRTNNRGDGLLIAVLKEYFKILNYKELHFNDCGDRVAQLLHVELTSPASQPKNNDTGQEILIVNTHLLFPHDSSLCIVRLHQAYKILQYVEAYQKEYQLKPLPIMLCGDWNGSKRGNVYKFLRSHGFVSSYDIAHHYTDADAHKWISHRNHRGNICAVDFIWLLNPDRYRKLLRASWSEAVFGMFKADNEDCITYSGFYDALEQLNLIGPPYGLSVQETKDLWLLVDIDGNGVLDFKEFQQHIWIPADQIDERKNEDLNGESNGIQEQRLGFSVKDAALFPPEAEKGIWPDDYSLSDHARLTVAFSPIRLSCSR
ncbi:putative calcium-binding protein [Senna tora]|uniref:Putative calcium-binding protein n=1 Tax=Senna tora TaxID=362788 RepID=A0A834U1Z0_9FABA|nr:putative calcium-binding protein [Senna tora]